MGAVRFCTCHITWAARYIRALQKHGQYVQCTHNIDITHHSGTYTHDRRFSLDCYSGWPTKIITRACGRAEKTSPLLEVSSWCEQRAGERSSVTMVVPQLTKKKRKGRVLTVVCLVNFNSTSATALCALQYECYRCVCLLYIFRVSTTTSTTERHRPCAFRIMPYESYCGVSSVCLQVNSTKGTIYMHITQCTPPLLAVNYRCCWVLVLIRAASIQREPRLRNFAPERTHKLTAPVLSTPSPVR